MPILSAARLASDPLFGIAADVPFHEVLSAIASPRPKVSREWEFTEQEFQRARTFLQDLGGLERAKLLLETVSRVSETNRNA